MFSKAHFLGVVSIASGLFVSISPAAHAETIRTRVFRVEPPALRGGQYEVLSTLNGRVYFVAPHDRTLVRQLEAISDRSEPTQLVLDGDRVIAAMSLSSEDSTKYSDAFDSPKVQEEASEALDPSAYADTEYQTQGVHDATPFSFRTARALGYSPTVFNSMSDAQTLFNSERELNHHSQCYERAAVWASEFEQTRGVQSMKVFMFFTKTFRQRYTSHILFWDRPYKWWFHVAPFVYVGNQEIVLDREFLNQAVTMNDWTFEFIGKVHHDNHEVSNPTRDQATCLEAGRYSEFSLDPNPSHLCVVRKVPMYYFQPEDVDALDCQSTSSNSCYHGTLTGWRPGDLKRAYKDTAR